MLPPIPVPFAAAKLTESLLYTASKVDPSFFVSVKFFVARCHHRCRGVAAATCHRSFCTISCSPPLETFKKLRPPYFFEEDLETPAADAHEDAIMPDRWLFSLSTVRPDVSPWASIEGILKIFSIFLIRPFFKKKSNPNLNPNTRVLKTSIFFPFQ